MSGEGQLAHRSAPVPCHLAWGCPAVSQRGDRSPSRTWSSGAPCQRSDRHPPTHAHEPDGSLSPPPRPALAACVATVSGAGHARPPFACSAPCTVRTWGFAREPDCPNPKPPKKQCLQSALWSPPPVASFPPDCVVALSGPARGPFGIRRARRVPPRSLAPFSFPSCCFHNPAAADSNWGAKILSSDAASALTGRHIQVWHVSLHRWQVYRCQGSQRNGPRHSRGCRVP